MEQMKNMIGSKYKSPPANQEIIGHSHKWQKIGQHNDAQADGAQLYNSKTSSPGSIVISITGNTFTSYNNAGLAMEPPTFGP